MNYRTKGGRFYKKDDLQKIYGLSDGQYQQLEPYITIVRKPFENKKNYGGSVDTLEQKIEFQTNKKKPVYIDINKATTEEWQALRGIGPTYAKRITTLRKELGGFVNIDQVAQTFRLPDSTFQKIKPFLKNTTPARKIPVNTCDVATLAAHPYLKYRQAKAIISYRKQHGPFTKMEDIKKIHAINEETFKQISPYFSID